jgi:hypothetical protein
MQKLVSMLNPIKWGLSKSEWVAVAAFIVLVIIMFTNARPS